MEAASRSRWPWVTAAAVAATCAWVTGALLMAGRGFDVSDEGFYVLSYRWWDSTPRVFTGVQYLYGPVFELLGWSLPGLRVVRLVSVLLAHVAFGWAYMSWLRTRRPAAPVTRGWEVAGTAVVVASGGVVYGWLPLTPGYNDVVLLGSLVLAALLLWSMTAVARGRVLPVAAALCSGPPVVALVLAKWAAAGVVGLFLGVVGVLALRALRARGWGRYLAAGLVSIASCLALVQVFVTPIPALASQMALVNRLVAADTNSPLQLLGLYVSSTARLTGVALVGVAVILALGALAALLRRTRFSAAALAVAVLAPVVGMLVLSPAGLGLPGGGAAALHRYVAVLISLSLVVLLAGILWRRRPRTRASAADVCVVVLLVLLPAVQALGTGNALAFVAVNAFACWAALLVAACTAEGLPGVGRALTVSATSCAVVVAATTGLDGLVRHPYRTASYDAATTRIGGTGPLAPLRVDRATAERFDAVRAAVGRQSEGSPVMAFDEMAGLVVLLDGRSVGEAWYSRLDPARTAAGITSACTSSWPWGSTAPVLLYGRPPGADDTRALRACGFTTGSGYRQVDVGTGRPTLRIYAPTDQGDR